MLRIIITVIFLVALAILIVMNVGSTADVNVFGRNVEQISVTVVAIVSFVTGVLYSFVFYLLSYLERGRRERLARRTEKIKIREADLRDRQRETRVLSPETSPGKTAREGPLTRLFGRGKTRTDEKPPRADRAEETRSE